MSPAAVVIGASRVNILQDIITTETDNQDATELPPIV